MSVRALAVCLTLAGHAGRAPAAEPDADIAAVSEPASRTALLTRIAALKDELSGLDAPGEDELERLERAHAALDGAHRMIAGAAEAAAAERDDGALVLAATIARAVRESRHEAVKGADALKLRTMLALSAGTLRSSNAEAASRLAVARRVDLLAKASGRQSALLREARVRIDQRRSELQARIAEAEAALGRMRESVPEPAAPPAPADEAPWLPADPLLAGPLLAEPDPAIAWSFAGSEPPAPGAGPSAPSTGSASPFVDDLDDLALAAPDGEIDAPAPSAPADPVVNSGWPIAGSISGAFGEDGAGPLDQGLTFVSDRAQPVRAPRSGTVVFAGPFLGFGLLLIVDHGHEYHSLLSGAARLDVRVGDVVVAGQIVGSIDGSEAVPARLYLELRHNGRPINPLPWLAAREDKVRG